MKYSLYSLTALAIIASASSANAADPYAQQFAQPYAQAQYAAPQYNYAPQQYAAAQQYNQAAAYNNYAPAAGRSSADSSRWPYWYVGLNAGVNFTSASDWEKGAASGDFDTKEAVSYSASIGYQPSNMRYELELGQSEQDLDAAATTGKIKATKLMANAIYDFGTNSGVVPFLGVGLGAVKADVTPTNVPTVNGASTKPAYQLIAGASAKEVLPQTDLSLAYKYLGTFSDFKEDTTKFEYNAHTIEAGAKFRF